MKRSGAVIAVCVTGLMILSACSSGKSGGTAGGGNSSPETASSHASSPPTKPSVVAPLSMPPASVRISAFTQKFASPVPASQSEAEVIAYFRKAQLLWIRSDIAMRLVAPVTEFVTGDALTNLKKAVAAGKSNDRVPAGTDRFWNTRVTALAGSKAIVTTCDDAIKYREINPSTGKIDPAMTPKPYQAYLYETWHMIQLSGRWAISSFTVATLPNPSAQPCQL